MIERVSRRPLRLAGKPVLAVFDVHGTLLKPTWLEEFARTYRALTGASPARSRRWASGKAARQAKALVVAQLAKECALPASDIEAAFASSREEVNAEGAPRPMPGAKAFVAALRRRGIPIVLLSGSLHEVIARQLMERGFLDLIPEEHIIGRDDMLRSAPAGARYDGRLRDSAIDSLTRHFPGHVPLNFNDWVGAMEAVHRLGGFNFGLPQRSDWERNRATLISAGADVILDGWGGRGEVLKLLAAGEQEAGRVAICEDKARELPVVLPARRPEGVKLFVDVARDLTRLSYRRVQGDSEGRLRLKTIASFPSRGLLCPERFIAHELPNRVRAAIDALRARGQRYTRYGGIVTSWDSAIDKDVWGANIDTVFLQRVIAQVLARAKKPPERVLEIGVGGGHISAFLVRRLGAGLRELSISDISLYALRTAKRNIRPYLSAAVRFRTFLGKGLQSMPGGADLIVVNPPYIPTSPYDRRPHRDPYRGTGLIKEIVSEGAAKLDGKNPEACILMTVSSLAARDFAGYTARYGRRMAIEPVGRPLTVPLKIYSISQAWKDWLVAEGLLEFDPGAGPSEEPYRHTLRAYRISRI